MGSAIYDEGFDSYSTNNMKVNSSQSGYLPTYKMYAVATVNVESRNYYNYAVMSTQYR